MTYQARAPKKAYFASGYEAGYKAAYDELSCETWQRCEHCGNEICAICEHIPTQDLSDDIDEAWDDYCDYWKAKAMELEGE